MSHRLFTYLNQGARPILFLHALATVAFATVGAMEWWPSMIQKSGYAQFASDSFDCHIQAQKLMHLLHQGEWANWFETHERFHTRLASICYALWGSFTGLGILSYWPINALMLFFSWKAWTQLFERFSGQAPNTSCLWFLFPSILLHYTQLIRDPLYICLFLFWLNAWIGLFEGKDKKQWLKAIAWLVFLSPLLYVSRSKFWVLCQVMSFAWLGLSLFLACSKKRPFHIIQWTGILFLGINSHMIIKAIYGQSINDTFAQSPVSFDAPKESFTFFYKVASLRYGFNEIYEHASDIDQDVSFKSDAEVVAYIPRAIQIGFLQPFPDRWFSKQGKTGLGGRLISIFEMCLILIIMPWTLWLIYKNGLTVPIFIALSAIVIVCVSVGMVVTNGGAIYRMRFASWLIWLAMFVALWQRPRLQKPI